MCGIVGFNWDDKRLLKRMSDTIIHRGPDDAAYYNDEHISFAMRRLSIIDLTPDIYPLTNEKEDVFLVFNGEIYNFQAIREMLEQKGHRFRTECDGETMVHAYEEFGEGFVNHLNGMFAVCLYDAKNKRLMLARDRIGIKPLYYYHKDGRLLWASEIKSILQYEGVKLEINREALNHNLALRYNPLSESIFKGVMKLEPGHMIIFDLKAKKLVDRKYWDINLGLREQDKPIRYYEEKLLELLQDSVRGTLISDVPLGAYLSGGIDSSAVVYMMDKIRKEENTNNKIRTYSVGFARGEKVNETSYAKKVSNLFNTEHKEFLIKPDVVKLLPKIVWHTDEPMADPALIPVYLLSEAAKKTSTVILTGDGGDEMFAGYDQYRFLKATHIASKTPFFKSTGPIVNKMIPLKMWDKFYKYSSDLGKSAYKRGDKVIRSIQDDKARAYYHLVGMFDDEEREALLTKGNYQEINYDKINRQYFSKARDDYLKQLLYYDTKRVLAEGFLMKTDRITMAQSIEARVPLLDHRIAELAFRIPSRYKLKGFFSTKHILKKALHGKLPNDILYRKKQSFQMPIENWLNKELKGPVAELLKSKELTREGILKPEEVAKIQRNYETGKLFYARQLWTIMTLVLWHRIYFQKQKLGKVMRITTD